MEVTEYFYPVNIKFSEFQKLIKRCNIDVFMFVLAQFTDIVIFIIGKFYT